MEREVKKAGGRKKKITKKERKKEMQERKKGTGKKINRLTPTSNHRTSKAFTEIVESLVQPLLNYRGVTK